MRVAGGLLIDTEPVLFYKKNMISRPFTRGLALSIFLSGVVTLPGQTQFYPLGYLDSYGPASEANAITRDGTKMVGYSTTNITGNMACWWTGAGIASVPGQQNWYANSAYAVSADGLVIVGDGSFGGTEYAWYWTPATQIQQVPFPSAQRSSTARGVSGNGRIVVGTAVSTGTLQAKAYRWDRSQASAAFLPPYPPSSVPNSAAAGVTDDGRRVVGAVQTGLNTYAAARWVDGGNPVLFNQAGDTIIAVSANAVTPDGAVVVGSAVNTATGKGVAFKWTQAAGVVALPNPTTGFYAIDGAAAIGVSGDGRVIVGYGQNVAGSDEAIFWVEGQPYRVSDVAYAAGVLPPSWGPYRAYAVDYFGNSIGGYGRATSGKLEAYVLILDVTPAPPPLVAPVLRSSFAAGTGMTLRYQTVPGLRYRMHGGTNTTALTAVGGWTNGLGVEQEFLAAPAVTQGANQFFFRLEVSQQ